MKKFLTSYVISIPLIVIALALFVQVSNPNYLISADQNVRSGISYETIQFIIAIVFLLLGVASIIFRYILRIKK